MSAIIKNLFEQQETLEQFVNRVGSVGTFGVECRFGLSNKEARKRLKLLADSGKIKCAGRHSTEWGAAYEWGRAQD